MEGVKQMLKDLKTGDDNVEEEAKSLMESLDIDNNGEIELWEVCICFEAFPLCLVALLLFPYLIVL